MLDIQLLLFNVSLKISSFFSISLFYRHLMLISNALKLIVVNKDKMITTVYKDKVILKVLHLVGLL